MKTNIIIIYILLLGSSLANWDAISSAGDRSSGGVYTLQDTLGESIAHRTSATTTTTTAITGGFWAFLSPASYGVPELYLERLAPGQVRVSWEPAAPGWILQRSDDLEIWTDLLGNNPTDAPLLGKPTFYRLTLP